MKTLHTAFRVQDLDRSLDFYQKVGFRAIGRVALDDGSTLVMLNLPDDDFVTLELVCKPRARPYGPGNGFSHIVVQVDDLEATLISLAEKGISVEEAQRPGGPDGPKTSFVADPDGYRIELVEWPAGHPDGMTAADFR